MIRVSPHQVATRIDHYERKENITMADVRWSADAKPAGLLAAFAG